MHNLFSQQNYLRICSRFSTAEKLGTTLPPFSILPARFLKGKDIRYIEKPGCFLFASIIAWLFPVRFDYRYRAWLQEWYHLGARRPFPHSNHPNQETNKLCPTCLG
jgi:hypothetical protein